VAAVAPTGEGGLPYSGELCVTARAPIGQILVEKGYLDQVQLTSGLSHQRQFGGRLGRALVSLRFVTEKDLMVALASQHQVLFIELGEMRIPRQVLRLLPEEYIRSHRVLPIDVAQTTRREPLLLATTEPQNLAVLDEVAFMTGRKVKPVLVGDTDLDRAIARHLGARTGAKPPSRV
jgi:hypothetical protein